MGCAAAERTGIARPARSLVKVRVRESDPRSPPNEMSVDLSIFKTAREVHRVQPVLPVVPSHGVMALPEGKNGPFGLPGGVTFGKCQENQAVP